MACDRASAGRRKEDIAHRWNAASQAGRRESSGISSTATERIRLFQAFSSALVSSRIWWGGAARAIRSASWATTRATPLRTSPGRSSQAYQAPWPSICAQWADCQASPQRRPSLVGREPLTWVATRYRIMGRIV